MTVKATRLILCVCIICLIVGCASHDSFTPLYNHYFPKQGKSSQSGMRGVYDRYLFSPNPVLGRPAYVSHHRAFHGDTAAAHEFLHALVRDEAGEYGERWAFDCFLLLLRLGDDRFAEILRTEDPKTRELVGTTIETFLDTSKHDFPATRALYRYRKNDKDGNS
jgi:hypothetical protein